MAGKHAAKPDPVLSLIPRQRTSPGRHAAPPQPLKLPRPRTIAAASLVVPVLASGAQEAVWHEPDGQDLSTTTGSFQAVQTVPVVMSPTAEPVEVPLPTAALSLADTREVLQEAQEARERAAVQAEQERQRPAERATREASAARVRHTAQPTPSATPTPSKAKTAPATESEPTAEVAGDRGAAVIAAARKHLGVPYVWGGESLAEGGFDCSGLTQWAYEQVGVDLPRTAAMQQRATTRITWSQARPGDLVFWGSPAHHVAIYLGDGLVISAPKRGDVVKIQAIWGDPTVRRVS